MAICYDSLKKLFPLQEGLLQQHSIECLLCMQPGINFVIYAVWTCRVIRLVDELITFSDADFNNDAKEYFTHHIRILEACTKAWPQPDMQKQIDGAFGDVKFILTQPTFASSKISSITAKGKLLEDPHAFLDFKLPFDVFSPLPLGQPNPDPERNALPWTAL